MELILFPNINSISEWYGIAHSPTFILTFTSTNTNAEICKIYPLFHNIATTHSTQNIDSKYVHLVLIFDND